MDLRYNTVYISFGSKPNKYSPYSEFQSIPQFLRGSEKCICVSIDDYPTLSVRPLHGVDFMEYPCQSTDNLIQAMETIIESLKQSNYKRLYICNFILFKLKDHASASERAVATQALQLYEHLPNSMKPHFFDWGGYDFPKIIIRRNDFHKISRFLNPLFYDKLVVKHKQLFLDCTIDITHIQRKHKTVRRKKHKPIHYLKAFKSKKN